MTHRITRIAVALLALVLAASVGHATRFYGAPWQSPTPEPVPCLRPASDGPVTVPEIGQAWPEVCWQTSDAGPDNSGVAVSLWSHYCAGIEWRGTPGVFYSLPIIAGNADC